MLFYLSSAVELLTETVSTGERVSYVGADDLIPVLYYCVLRTKAGYLQSVFEYINKMCNPKDLIGGYGADGVENVGMVLF